MEKRKLAKIPREEASDEMVRFAERAAGTHIVTTRDIDIPNSNRNPTSFLPFDGCIRSCVASSVK